MSGSAASRDVGERFVRSVAAKDSAALKELLAPAVNFRALTPGRAWESDRADSVVDDVILGTWFAPDRSVTQILAIECGRVGPVDHVGYRFRATLPDGEYVIEQQAYLRTEGGRIYWLRVLCSGFVHDE
jgi:hypothetical protein